MATFDIPQPTIEIENRTNSEDDEFLDTFEGEPLSRQYLYALVTKDDNMDEIEIVNVIDDVTEPERFSKFNEDPENLPNEEIRNITGILFHMTGDDIWYGAFLFKNLGEWAYTVYGEDKEEVENAHELYTSGYGQRDIEEKYDKNELIATTSDEEEEQTEEANTVQTS